MTIFKVIAEYFRNGEPYSLTNSTWQICSTEKAARSAANACQRELAKSTPPGVYVKPLIYVMNDYSDGVFHATKTITV